MPAASLPKKVFPTMVVYPPEDRNRQRRTKSEQAIQLAMKNRWDEAAQLNREILTLFPEDVDALNRLGKALMELGRYADARDAYGRAAKADPMNSIATKNLQRLAKLAEEGAAAPPPSPVDPRLFIEESGKTTVTQLTAVPKSDATAKLSAGDALQFAVRGNQVWVVDNTGADLGRLEPKLEQDLLKLFGLGNQYAVFVTSVADGAVSVIVREAHRSPQMGNRPSFRPAAETAGRAYTREGLLRDDMDDEDEDEADEEEETETEAEPAAEPAEAETTSVDTLAAAEDAEEDEDEEK